MRVILSAGKRIYFTLLASSFMFPISAFAQCAETDCNTLGYDSPIQCDNGIKCPFGEYWACRKHCNEAYKYTCLGANEQPTDDECGRKYKNCNCTSGYEWKNEKCEKKAESPLGKCTGKAKNCKIADILYSDGTCSADAISDKTPVGIVAYINEDGCGQALALEGIGYFAWSTEFIDIPELPNWNGVPIDDFASCENTKIVIDYSSKQHGNSAPDYYPAFWQVYNYAPADAPETKGKWCLPAGGVLYEIGMIDGAIDKSLSKINKPNIGSSSWWLSSEHSANNVRRWNASTGGFSLNNSTTKDHSYYIRPVIEF